MTITATTSQQATQLNDDEWEVIVSNLPLSDAARFRLVDSRMQRIVTEAVNFLGQGGQGHRYFGDSVEADFLRITIGNSACVEQIPQGRLIRALLHAATKGYRSIVKKLLECSRSGDISAVDLGSALQDAAFNGRLDIVKALLECSRSGDIPADYLGWALQGPAFNGRLDILKALLECSRSDAIPAGTLGSTLQHAALNGHLDIVKALLECRRSGDIPAGYLGWALQDAAIYGYLDIVKAIRTYKKKRFMIAVVKVAVLTAGALAIALCAKQYLGL